VITHASGLPLAGSVTQANRHDVTEMAQLVNNLEVPRLAGHSHRQPGTLQGDLASDSVPHRQRLESMGIEPILPQYGTDEDTGLGETRWPVERTRS
jgi:hypothetical protein